jgi:hypothetical protein
MPKTEKLVTAAYVARRFGVTDTTIRRWIDDGILKVATRTMGGLRNTRGHARFKQSEVDQLWQDNEARNLGSKSEKASGTLFGTTPRNETNAGKVWIPAITSKQRPGSQSSSSAASTTPKPAPGFLD